LFVLVVAVSVGVALLRGGTLSGLAKVSFHYWWLMPLALVGRFSPLVAPLRPVLPRYVIPDFLTVGGLLYEVSMVIIFGLLAVNINLPGMPFVVVGWFLNYAVVVANGGHMPIPAEFVIDATTLGTNEWTRLTVLTPDAPFCILGDVIRLSLPVLDPGALSIGDILIATGGFLFFQEVMVPPSASGSAHPSFPE